MKILLVEDEFLLAFLLREVLTDAGPTIVGSAETASQGLEIAETDPPDLALVNISLKDGSRGTDLARTLQDRWARLALLDRYRPDWNRE